MWIFRAAERGRKGGAPREQRIAREILGVLEGESDVFKWLEERHKMAALARWVGGWLSLLVDGDADMGAGRT